MRILHFGTFDHDIGRNAIVAGALREAGVEVVDCHVPLWRGTDDKLRAVRRAGGAESGRTRIASLVGLAVTAARVLRAQARLWARARAVYRSARPIDAVLVGSTGHLDLPLARLVASRLGAALVFDPLISIGETVRDRGLLPPGGARMRALAAAERRLFALADHVLVDTAAHAAAFEAELGLDPARVSIVPASAPSAIADIVDVYRERAGDEGGTPLRIVYAGQYIPLHGVETLLRAADRLRDRADIRFELVGVGQTLAAARALAVDLGLPNVRFIETWMPVERLAREYLAPADICLGIFGDQPKARRVVPFKVYAALAAGRPVVTADTPAVRELLAVRGGTEAAGVGARRAAVGAGARARARAGATSPTGATSAIAGVGATPALAVEVEIVPAGDPAALAAMLRALADDPARRRRLAYAGRAAYRSRFAPANIGEALVAALELAAHRPAPGRATRAAWRRSSPNVPA